MVTTKYKVLKVLLENQGKSFDKIQVNLEKAFPDMSWQEIESYLALLADEKYIVTSRGDDEILEVCINDSAYAKLCEFQELAKDEKEKRYFDKMIDIFKAIKPF